MKKQPRKLRLESQTLRPLTIDQIRDVHGGLKLSQLKTACATCNSGDVTCACEVETARCI